MADTVPSIPTLGGGPSAISTLGESLLTQQRQRNDQVYKRSKNEAYKIALGTAGAGFINETLKNDVSDFMQNEPVISAKVKQNQGYLDATAAQQERAAIDASGLSDVDYYKTKLAPQAQTIADAQLRASGGVDKNGKPLSAGDYNLYVQSIVNQVAQQKAKAFQDYYGVASTVESPTDFQKFETLRNERPTSAFDALYKMTKNAFHGKNQSQIDQDSMDAITNNPELKKAENATQLRKVFDQTGDLSLSLKVTDAINNGGIGTDKRPATWAPYESSTGADKGTGTPSSGGGKVIEVNNGQGGKTAFVLMIKKNANGTEALDANGMPQFLQHEVYRSAAGTTVTPLTTTPMKSIGPLGEQVESIPYVVMDGNKVREDKNGNPIVVNHTVGVDPSAVSPDITRLMDKVTKEEAASQQDNLRSILTGATPEEKQALDDYRIKIGGGLVDPKTKDIKGDKLDSTYTNLAANARIISANSGVDKDNAQRLMGQVFVNRLNDVSTKSPGHTLFGASWGSTTTVDLSKSRFNSTPTMLELFNGVANLDSTVNRVKLTDKQALDLISGTKAEFANMSPQDRVEVLQKYSAHPEKYAPLFVKGASGDSMFSILAGIHEQGLPKGTQAAASSTPVGTPIPSQLTNATAGNGGAVTDLNFVKRYLNPENYPKIDNADGSYSTHLMASGEINGKFVAYPTIIQNKDGSLKHLSTKEAGAYAQQTGEFVQFPTDAEARKYAENGYKADLGKGVPSTSIAPTGAPVNQEAMNQVNTLLAPRQSGGITVKDAVTKAREATVNATSRALTAINPDPIRIMQNIVDGKAEVTNDPNVSIPAQAAQIKAILADRNSSPALIEKAKEALAALSARVNK